MKQTTTSATAKTLKNGKTRAEQRAIINAYILSCIPDVETINSEYDLKLANDKDRVNFVMSEFERCSNYPHNFQKFPNIADRFGDWLQGLPVFQIDYENYAILQIAKKWGSLPEYATEYQEDKILANWWNYIANKFFQLHKHLNKA